MLTINLNEELNFYNCVLKSCEYEYGELVSNKYILDRQFTKLVFEREEERRIFKAIGVK